MTRINQGVRKAGGPITILLAGADEVVVQAVRNSLSDPKFELHNVCDVDEALAFFDAGLPDALLVVENAAGLDGEPLAELIRSRVGGWLVPVLSLVSSGNREVMEQALALGATDIIPLPLNEITLPLRICHHLEMEQARLNLAQSRIRIENLQSFTGVGTWEWRRDSGVAQWSNEINEILGVEQEPEERSWEWFLGHVVLEDRDFVMRGMSGAVAEGIGFDFEHRIRRGDRSERYVRHRGRVVHDASGAAAIVSGAIQDITSRKLADETIRSLAYFDHLTGLPNRLLSKDRLEIAISQAARHERMVGFLVFDVDGFKRINGSMSHAMGDQLLEQVAERLQASVRDCDVVASHEDLTKDSSISRLGGNEFAILLTEIVGPEGATRVARRIVDSLGEPFALDGNDIFITASIGISLYPHDGDNANALVEHAVTALGSAKAREGNSIAFFDATLDESARRSFMLESGLHRAIQNDELHLCFQPKVWSATREICGMEALLRWNHPELGAIAPTEFIPIAENTGLISSIGEWVLRTACRLNKQWQDEGLARVPIAVNLSGHQFRDTQLDVLVESILEETGLAPEYLELEITESIMMTERLEAAKTLDLLRKKGIRVALDDFGTGFSSLGYVKDFPLDAIKIDRFFIRDIELGGDAAAIVQAIVGMAHSLGIRVVAEGVEERAQVESASTFGCDELQGYFFSRPISEFDFPALLAPSGCEPSLS